MRGAASQILGGFAFCLVCALAPTVRPRLRIWQPFVALTFSVKTKPRPANGEWMGAKP